MGTFTILNTDMVTADICGCKYTVMRDPNDSKLPFAVYCVNASSKAWRRGFPVGRHFATLEEVERAYKRLRGISAVFATIAGPSHNAVAA